MSKYHRHSCDAGGGGEGRLALCCAFDSGIVMFARVKCLPSAHGGSTRRRWQGEEHEAISATAKLCREIGVFCAAVAAL